MEENPERKKYSYMFAEKFRLRAYMNWNRIPDVFEAIAKAGGLTENAAAEAVNQARVVVDGEQIYVPSLDEARGVSAVCFRSSGQIRTEMQVDQSVIKLI